ncbi:MAG: SprT-like domain-containing protein [Bacteroidales bacterium]|jgi:hypothetical protein|nr:SprT-like domain-containing protein [Bacteroidales bacterium]
MKEGLSKYLPSGAIDLVYPFLKKNNVHVTITANRVTKQGDYRPPINYPAHRITINGTLNPYAFLITLVHEMAHLKVWEKTKSLKDPHGVLWKNTFIEMMIPFLENKIFPDDIQVVLIRHLTNPKAASNSDKMMTEALRRYDKNQKPTLNDIPEGTSFTLNGRIFRKGQKLRTYYLCECLTNRRKYRVSGIAEIVVSTTEMQKT